MPILDYSAENFELDLLLSVARRCASGSPEPVVPNEIDWGRFFALAGRHGLRAHACRILHNACPAHWQTWFQANARRNLGLTGELVRVLRVLAEGGVIAVPFKGPALAAQAYGDLALRECGDLDVIVRPPDVLRAKALLLRAGYRLCHPFTRAQERAYLHTGCELNFENPAGICLDLQWRPAPAHFCVEVPPAAWDRLRPSASGGEVAAFAPEDLLALLCVHGAKHLWRRLIWVCDVAAVARTSGLDWDLLLHRAEEMRAQRMVLLGLCLAADLVHARLANGIADRVSEFRDRRMGRQFLSDDSAPVTLADHWFLGGLRERWRDRARYFTRLAFTPAVADWDSASRFYVLARMARLTRRLVTRA